ncbi:MAG TPA: 50S ribosomal protein L25 [Gammaproteobacteria bacterium]|nr:50S ribosomal protein L25 [Gammaproteobacteria bacterium]HAO70085.1 50S ribosomal protein L25 [Gammaproteobacteria bacterium]HBN57757.1 50S ribosomal protein L25 [Gammaproteobacteria bacterium]HCJ13332.1 50S ribosomal protein L25 [Gammaproteobacteria bacterium]
MGMIINATTRDDQGKGASRRLRREEKLPAIVYGAGKEPSAVSLNIHEITHLLENDDAFTSVLDLSIDKKVEPVIIKDLQRHPAKNTVTHVDLLRINMKQAIVTSIPLNFTGSDDNEEIRLGAILNQFINAVEVSCLPADMPNGIEVDISNLAIGDHISLTGLNMPEGVTLTALTHGDIEAHDQSVVAVQEAKLMAEEVEEEIVEAEGDEGDESAEGGDAEKNDSDS